MPDRSPAGHRQQRDAEQVVEVHQRQLAERGDHEAGHRDAENHQKHDDDVRQAIAVQGRQGAPEHAAQTGKDDGQDAEGRGYREMLADDVVDLAVLLGEGDAEIAAQQVAHVDQVLLGHRAVEAVLGLEVGTDLLGDGLVAGQRVAGHVVHGDEGGGGDEPHRDHALYQSFEGISPHAALRFPVNLPGCARG